MFDKAKLSDVESQSSIGTSSFDSRLRIVFLLSISPLMRYETTSDGINLKSGNSIVLVYISIKIDRLILQQCIVVTISLGGVVAEQMRYNLESANFLWLGYYIIMNRYILVYIYI